VVVRSSVHRQKVDSTDRAQSAGGDRRLPPVPVLQLDFYRLACLSHRRMVQPIRRSSGFLANAISHDRGYRLTIPALDSIR
jgi:hypothetical protein